MLSLDLVYLEPGRRNAPPLSLSFSLSLPWPSIVPGFLRRPGALSLEVRNLPAKTKPWLRLPLARHTRHPVSLREQVGVTLLGWWILLAWTSLCRKAQTRSPLLFFVLCALLLGEPRQLGSLLALQPGGVCCPACHKAIGRSSHQATRSGHQRCTRDRRITLGK